ncbi:MAG: hypothetical protein AB7F65_06755 [Dehalococcoidia bacterium]
MSDDLTEASITNRLLGALITQDMGTNEGAATLARLGMANRDIAAVLDTSEATVRAAASRAKAAKK